MAWEVKYRLEFKDLYGLDWQVDIEEDDFAGSITDLTGTGDPLNFEWENNADDVFDTLHPGKVSINVLSLSNFALTDLYSVDDMQFRVQIYQNSTLFWKGYVITGDYSEPYEDYPYPVTIKATCGLELLEDMEFKNGDAYYTDRALESTIIFTVLAKIGYSEIYEYINLYEANHYEAYVDSPIAQTTVDQDVFKGLYCDEVLHHILSKYNARIIQVNGIYVLYRPLELVQATVYGRHFSNATTYSNTSYFPAQYINRATHETDIQQIPGGVLMLERPASKVTVSQNYGNKESWIDNWDLKAETYDATNFTYDSWTRSGTQGLNQMGDLIPGEVDGMPLPRSTDSVNDDYFYQSFGDYGITTTGDVFIFSFEYLFYNYGSVAGEAILYLQITDGTNYLEEVDDRTCDWTTTPSYIVINLGVSIPVGKTAWTTFERSIIGLDGDGPLTVKVFQIESTDDIYGGVKNIRFYTTNDLVEKIRKKRKFWQRLKFTGSNGEWQIALRNKYRYVKTINDQEEVTEAQYVKSNSINGVEKDYDYILGDITDTDGGDINIDNILEQFAGGLGTYDYVAMTNDFSTNWHTRDGSENVVLRQLICDEIANEYSRPKQLIQMSIMDKGSSSPAINLIGNFQDDLNQYGGNNRRFVFNRGNFSAYWRKWMIDLAEIVLGGSDPAGGDGADGVLPDTHDPESFPSMGYGALYNWYAVNNAHGLAPSGWHVPTATEWEALRSYLDPGGDSLVNTAGRDMKETGTSHWQDAGGTNASGFTARGSGERDYSTGAFSGQRLNTEYWTSNTPAANVYGLTSGEDAMFYSYTDTPKMGRSVRLIKDDSTDPGTMTDYDGIVYPTIKIGDQVWMATNLCSYHYADGTAIPMITDNTAWAADSTGAFCFYNNDIVTIDSIDFIGTLTHAGTFSPSFKATTPATVTITVYWQIRDNLDLVVSSGNASIEITAGTGTYYFTSLDVPDETGDGYYMLIGKTSSPTLESNKFAII